MKPVFEIELDHADQVDEYDDYQHDVSNSLANLFIDQEILPALQEFDYKNECSEYIPGIATFCLFAKLMVHLMSEGYTVDDLKSMVEDFSHHCVDGTVH